MALRFADKDETAKTPKARKTAAALRKPKVGKPLKSEAHLTLTATKPWEALGMSRRTWYRRQKEKR